MLDSWSITYEVIRIVLLLFYKNIVLNNKRFMYFFFVQYANVSSVECSQISMNFKNVHIEYSSFRILCYESKAISKRNQNVNV